MILPGRSAHPWLYTLFLALLSCAYALQLPPLQGAYLVVAMVVVLLNVGCFSSASNAERVLMGLFALTMTMILPLSALRSPAAVGHYVIVLVGMAAAFVMTRDRDSYLAGSRVSLVVVQAGVFAYLSVRGFDNFPLEGMIGEQSSNGITSYLIIMQANYSAFRFLVQRRASTLTAIATLVICVVGYGRGSILASIFILVINLLSYISWRTIGGGIARALGGAAVLGLVALLYSDDIALFLEANTKLGGGLFDEARERILIDYVGRLDPLTVFSGGSYEGTSIVSDFRGNPHNSYIRAHHVFGLPYLAVLLMFPLVLAWSRQALTVKLFLGALLVAILFRASTEPLMFPTLFDFYFFALCFGLSAPARPPVRAPAKEATP